VTATGEDESDSSTPTTSRRGSARAGDETSRGRAGADRTRGAELPARSRDRRRGSRSSCGLRAGDAGRAGRAARSQLPAAIAQALAQLDAVIAAGPRQVTPDVEQVIGRPPAASSSSPPRRSDPPADAHPTSGRGGRCAAGNGRNLLQRCIGPLGGESDGHRQLLSSPCRWPFFRVQHDGWERV